MDCLSKRFNASNIFLAMRPIFLISKFFGTYNYSHSKIYKNLLKFYTFLMVILVSWSSVYSFVFIDAAEAEWYSNLVFFYIEKSHIIFLYISFVTTVYFHLFKQKQLGKELVFLDNVDTYLKQKNFHFIYFIVNHVWVGFFLILIVFVMLILDYLLYTNSHTFYATIQLISMYIPFLTINSSVAQWYSIIQLIGDHFVFITRSLFSTTDRKRLSILIRVHGRLCTISRRINNLFGPNLFVMITYIYVMMTEYIFLTMKITVAHRRQPNNISYAVAVASFTVASFFGLWAIVNSCYRTSTEADVFTRTLYRLMIKDDAGLINQNDVFYLQITMKNTLVFTAWNFFQINRSLLYSMTSATATLVVILIQFDMSQASEKTDNHFLNSTSSPS